MNTILNDFTVSRKIIYFPIFTMYISVEIKFYQNKKHTIAYLHTTKKFLTFHCTLEEKWIKWNSEEKKKKKKKQFVSLQYFNEEVYNSSVGVIL